MASDPRKRVYGWEERWENGVVRLRWDADAAGVLEAEYRLEGRRRLDHEEVKEFWAEVQRKIAPLGPLSVEGADPRP